MEHTERILRIMVMEEKFDQALAAVRLLDSVAAEAPAAFAQKNFEAAIPQIEDLIAYYESGLWMDDFNADSKGNLPPNLKRGVLSEDGIYNLLTDYQRLKETHIFCD